jgi:predicted kinase
MDHHKTGARLIIVCGLPGSGKTTLARRLEQNLGAVRFSPDEWIQALSLNFYDEQRRARIEAMQWELAQMLLKRGLIAIIEWGTWGRSERDALRLGARKLGAAVELRYLPVSEDVLLERVHAAALKNRPLPRKTCRAGSELFRPLQRKNSRCSMLRLSGLQIRSLSKSFEHMRRS